MHTRIMTALAIGALFATQNVSGATSTFVPVSAEVKPASSTDLNWLRNKLGDDGYVRVLASLDLESPCLPVGRGGFASTVGREKVQLAVSVNLSGLASPLAGKEIPIAAVDGRDTPGGCIEVNSSTITIVPITWISRIKVDEPIAAQVKLRTISDTDLNLVSTARAGLTVASLFASPAAVAGIGSISKIIADPALANVEKYMEARMAGRTPAQKTKKFTAQEFRNGIAEISFPVHIGEYGFRTDKPSDEAKAIPLIASEKEKSKEPPTFWVKLNFIYTRSIFPLTFKPDGAPASENIEDGVILAHPGDEDEPSVLPSVYQWLSGTGPKDPKLLQLFASATTANEFKEHCDKALEILEKRGLNILDRSLALRSFINAARGSDAWYGTSMSSGCTQGSNKKVGQAWLAVFGPAPPPVSPSSLETMSRPPTGQDKMYDAWVRRSIPALNSLRTALKAAENQEAYLMKATKGNDLAILAPTSVDAWPEVKAELCIKSWIARITAKRAKAVGCFNYPYGSDDFDLDTNAGSFLILDEKGTIWASRASFGTADSNGLAEVEIFQLNSGWKSWYEDLVQRSLLSSKGDCAVIMKAMPSAPLGVDS